MLFLYRPPQTYMPYRVRPRTQQAEYNRQLQQRFQATRRVTPAAPVADLPPPTTESAAESPPLGGGDAIAALKELAALHESGALSDDEFTAAKAKLLA